MTKLLISVRNAVEAQIAVDAGADLIDVKEPAHGSLGAADPGILEAVLQQVNDRRPLSAALGELLSAVPLPAAFAGRLRYAKFGLAGCGTFDGWIARWQQAIERLPRGVEPVAVAYADWQSALAPDPWHVLERAHALRCAGVLVDTHDKTRGPLSNHLAWHDLRRFISAVQTRGMFCAVAGSLGWEEIRNVLPLAPEYVAVRGAACVGDRTGALDAARVGHLAALVHGGVPGNAARPAVPRPLFLA